MPETSAPTLCYNFTVQEALSANATVSFSQAIYHYNENFLNFPVGTHIPSGWLNEKTAAWVPSDDGRVIRI